MIDGINLGAAIAALAVGVWLAGGANGMAWLPGAHPQSMSSSVANEDGAEADGAEADDTREERLGSVVDATGTPVPVGRYLRIASATTIGDQVLDAIVEPTRLIAITGESLRTSETPWRHAGRAVIHDLSDLETILALRPDLVVVANVAEARRVARLREAGLEVFDIGEASGVRALTHTMRQLGALVAAPERADRLARRFETRMRAIASPGGRHSSDEGPGEPHSHEGRSSEPASGESRGEQQAREQRPTGIYLSSWGGRFYGGAAGTGFHDVLEAAGLHDAAAEAGFAGWPAYAIEELLRIDPHWIVAPSSQAEHLCRHEVLESLRACREGRIVAIDDRLINDPGLGMLPAAEAVRAQVFADP